MALTINWLKLGAVALGVTAVFLAYKHYAGLVDSKAELSARVATLQADVSRESARADAFEKAIDKWESAAEDQREALTAFNKAQREAGAYQREILDVLSSHDLGALAKRKPGLIERRVNAGTDRALRLLESASEGATAGGSQAAPDSGTP